LAAGAASPGPSTKASNAAGVTRDSAAVAPAVDARMPREAPPRSGLLGRLGLRRAPERIPLLLQAAEHEATDAGPVELFR
jgi:hypothetical protein